MADLITKAHGVPVELTPGARGELSVWVNGRVVAKKDLQGWPPDDVVLSGVGRALQTA